MNPHNAEPEMVPDRPKFDDPVVEGIASAFDESELRELYPDAYQLRVNVVMPHSEVCIHLKIAGKLMWVEDVGRGMAQLYDQEFKKFSMPITWGEAGVYQLFRDIFRKG